MLAGERDDGAVLRVEDVHKYYDMGETRVHALRGVSLERGGGRVRRHHGRERQRQVDADEHPRLPRPAERRAATCSTASTSSQLDKRTLAGIRNRKLGFVFQGFNLMARTTALENTALPTLYTTIDKAERASARERGARARRTRGSRAITFRRRCRAASSSASRSRARS